MKNIRKFLYFFGMQVQERSPVFAGWIKTNDGIIRRCVGGMREGGKSMLILDDGTSISRTEESKSWNWYTAHEKVNFRKLHSCRWYRDVARVRLQEQRMSKPDVAAPQSPEVVKSPVELMIRDLTKVTSDEGGIYCNGVECFIL